MKTLQNFKIDFKVITEHAETYPNPFMAAEFANKAIKMIIAAEYMHIEKECEEYIEEVVKQKLESLGLSDEDARRNVVDNILKKMINDIKGSRDGHCGHPQCTGCNMLFGKQGEKKTNGDSTVVPFPDSGTKH